MKKIEYQAVSIFPKLAWVSIIDEKRTNINVYHGKYVECQQDWFIEGIWDGPFDDDNFHETDLIFGTGMKAAGENIIFVSSSSAADRLYYSFYQDKLLVSNSLPCLIAFTDIEMAPEKDYAEFFRSLEKYFGKYERELPVRDANGKILNILGDNLVYSSGKVTIEAKPQKHHFNDFVSLSTFMRESFLRLKNNWECSGRENKLLTFSTISTGYDSAAVSFFAAQAGCNNFFTCVSSNTLGPKFLRSKRKKMDDGSKIAGHMGKTCIKFDRHDFKDDFSNEIYLFPGMPNTRLTNFLPMINYLDRLNEPSILFTGIGGDSAWGGDSEDSAYDYGVISLSEIRLKSGFIHCSFLFWLSRFRALLLEISGSEEMKRWSIRSSYDRPIPRRMLEEAGIPRSEFGYVKKGGWNWFRIPNRPFDPKLRQQYYKYLTINNLCSRWKTACFPVLSTLYFPLKVIMLALFKMGFKSYFKNANPPFARIAHSTFPWAVKTIADEYRERLSLSNG
jgi:hypothetical protein